MRTGLCLLVLVLAFGMTVAAEPTADAQFTVRIYRVTAPPVLDGKMDDACWKDAAVSGDFRMFQKPADAATQRTEVRLCYDAENLYVFWRLFESRMDKLQYGPAEDMRDLLDFSGDVAELFLDPGKTRQKLIQLCSSPLGTRYDGSSDKGAFFNPDWRVKPGTGPDGWTLEAAIPFAELAQKGEFLGTPQAGEEWGIQFCRDQALLHEWSQWKPTPTSFHQVDQFGTAVFMGPKDGAALPRITRVPSELLGFGTGAVELGVEPAAAQVAVEYSLLKNGTQREQKRLAFQNGAARVPYHITEGGKWGLRVVCRAGETPLYVGYTFTRLPMIREDLEDIGRNVQAAREALKGFQHAAAAELTASVDRLAQTAAGPLETLRKADTLSRAEWNTLGTQVAELGTLWKDLRFDLHLMRWYAKAGAPQTFTLGVSGPDTKVYRKTLFDGDVEAPARVALAGREYESFQLVVIPFWQKLDGVTVEFSDLAGPQGKIAASNMSYRLVDYVRLEGVDPDDPEMNEYEPDILWPGKPFAVPRGEVHSVWVDVYLPEGTPAGEYAGQVSVSAAGQTVTKALTVQAYGFDLPAVATLENNFWFGPTDFDWGRFYGAGHYGKIEYTPALYERHAQVLSRYRVTCFADSALTLSPHFKIFREPDGHYTFDFSKWEEFIAIGKKYGSNAYRAALSCNLGAMYLFREDRLVLDRASGKEVPVKELIADWLKGQKDGSTYWDTHPIYRDYLTAYVAFMKRVGVFDMASWEIYDEPNSNPRWLDMIRHHKFLRQHVPELQLTNYGVDPTIRRSGKTALGLIDVWAPHLPDITPEALRIMQERRARFGEKFWFYTCGERRDKDGNVSPYLYYHRPYLGPRMHAWYAWDLQADGMLVFAISGVPDSDVKPKNREQQWPASEWLDGKSRGCGTLIYPGPDFELIPGMRLASTRDGLEDYEYFHLLRRLLAYADAAEDKAFVEATERELRIEKEILDGYFVWTKDRRVLEAKRDRLAALIRDARQRAAAR